MSAACAPDQVSVVEEVSSGEMLLRTGETVMAIMRDFQARALRQTWLPLSVRLHMQAAVALCETPDVGCRSLHPLRQREACRPEDCAAP